MEEEFQTRKANTSDSKIRYWPRVDQRIKRLDIRTGAVRRSKQQKVHRNLLSDVAQEQILKETILKRGAKTDKLRWLKGTAGHCGGRLTPSLSR